jgi:Ca2+-binding RTX toxin-like protein
MPRLTRHVLFFSALLFSATPTVSASIGRVIASGYQENTLSTKTFEYVAAPGEANAITIRRDYDAKAWVITDPGAIITAGRGCRSLWSHRIVCRWADENNWRVAAGDRADRILLIDFCQVSCDFKVYGGRGNDVIRNQGAYWARLSGGAGNDSIFGGQGPEFIYGDAGKDRLYGGFGLDDVYGGSGNDMLWGGRGQDLIAGNDGDDRFDSRDGLRDSVRGGLGTDSALVDEGIDSVQSVEMFERK